MEALSHTPPRPVPFDFDGRVVRVIVDELGEPWFVAADVGAALGHSNIRVSVAALDDDERGVNEVDTPGGRQEVTVVNEAGLYSLILRSRIAGAKRFKRWVTHKVLPQIRRTGGYATAPAAPDLRDPLQAVALLAQSLQVLQEEQERCRVLQAENAELAPKAATFDRCMSAEGTYLFREACKILERSHGVTEKQVRAVLFNAGLVQRLAHRMQATYRGTSRGLVTTRAREWTDDFGIDHQKPELRITAKGLAWLDQRLAAERAA